MLLFIFVFSVGSTKSVWQWETTMWRQERSKKLRLCSRNESSSINLHQSKIYQKYNILFSTVRLSETATGGVPWKRCFLKISQNLKENIFARLSFLIKFFKKETLAQVSSCKVCKIFTKILFIEHFWACATASKARIEEAKKGFMRPWIAHENFRKTLILDIIIQDDKTSCIFVMPAIGLLKCIEVSSERGMKISFVTLWLKAIWIVILRSGTTKMFGSKGVLKNVVKLEGKHM